MNPLEPRPGDWEAALKVIQEAELRHDRKVLWRKRLGMGAAAAAVALALWGGYSLRDAEVASEAQTVEVPSERTQAPESDDAVLQGGGDQTSLPAEVQEVSETPANEVAESPVEAAPVQRTQRPRAAGESVGARPSAELAKSQSALEYPIARVPIPLPALLSQSHRPSFMPISSKVAEAPMERRWSVHVGREQGAWFAGVTTALWGEGMPALRLGMTWDQRSRQWVAHPEAGVFGPRPARGIASDEAHWIGAGADWTRHLKGRWGWAATCEAQFLVARLMTPSTYEQSESLAPSGTSVWGTLEEEQRIRLRWSVGADWSVTDRQSVRLAIGGYLTPERQWDYMDFTSGAPRTVGELRATWFWK